MARGDFASEVALCRAEYRDLLAITRYALEHAPLAGYARLVEAIFGAIGSASATVLGTSIVAQPGERVRGTVKR